MATAATAAKQNSNERRGEEGTEKIEPCSGFWGFLRSGEVLHPRWGSQSTVWVLMPGWLRGPAPIPAQLCSGARVLEDPGVPAVPSGAGKGPQGGGAMRRWWLCLGQGGSPGVPEPLLRLRKVPHPEGWQQSRAGS